MQFREQDYWDAIGQPHAEQLRLLELVKENRRIAGVCGRRWGKSWLLSAWVLWRTLCGDKCWWLAPSYQLSKAGFDYCVQHVRRLPAPIRKRISIKRSSPFEISFRDGHCTFLTSDNIIQLQGRGLDIVVVDEAGDVRDLLTVLDQFIGPTLIDRGGKLVVVGTPRGGLRGEYYAITQREEFVVFHSASYMNPHIDHEELDRLSQELPDAIRRQELEGEFVDLSGSAFPNIVVEELDIAAGSEAVTGIDFGLFAPFCAILLVRVGDKWLAADEVWGTDIDAHRQAEMILAMESRHPVKVIRRVLDATCFSRLDGLTSIAQRYQERQCYVQPATRDRSGSLALMRQMLNTGQLVVSPRCEHLLDELRQAEIHPSRVDDITGEDHCLDSLRYALSEALSIRPKRETTTDPMSRFIQRSLRRSGVKV